MGRSRKEGKAGVLRLEEEGGGPIISVSSRMKKGSFEGFEEEAFKIFFEIYIFEPVYQKDFCRICLLSCLSRALLPPVEGHADDTSGLLLILSLIVVISTVASSQSTVNVLDTSAVGDGHADDTSAFIKAWDQACSSVGIPTIFIPKGKLFLVRPMTFAGQCKSSQINIVLAGTIVAPEDSEAWNGREDRAWLVFENVNGLTISGGGVLNRSGKQYHPGPSLAISGCQDFTLNLVTIDNSKGSPKMDGIHLSQSRDVAITNCNIITGDDCISRGDQVYNVSISNVICGAG